MQSQRGLQGRNDNRKKSEQGKKEGGYRGTEGKNERIKKRENLEP